MSVVRCARDSWIGWDTFDVVVGCDHSNSRILLVHVGETQRSLYLSTLYLPTIVGNPRVVPYPLAAANMCANCGRQLIYV